MGDAAENEDLGGEETIDDGDLANEEIQNEDIDDSPQPSDAEVKALNLGWKPRDEWEGDPDDWTSAKRFNQTRDIIDSNKSLRANQDRLEHNFNERLENTNKLNKQIMEAKVVELKSKRDSAAAEADMPTYNEANKQLEDLEAPEKPAAAPNNQANYAKAVYDHPVTQQFITDNPWIKGDGAKAVYGQKIFADYLANSPANGTIEEGLQLVKTSVNREFPQKNANRESRKTLGERGRGPGKVASRNSLTMDDLTREEKNIYDEMGSQWKDQKEFLQAVADLREGE